MIVNGVSVVGEANDLRYREASKNKWQEASSLITNRKSLTTENLQKLLFARFKASSFIIRLYKKHEADQRS